LAITALVELIEPVGLGVELVALPAHVPARVVEQVRGRRPLERAKAEDGVARA
jgi:hypothetical protein